MTELKRILIIEDDEAIRELLTVMLTEAGYSVASAADGRLGLARCASFDPDLIVLDLMMPVLDGAGFLRDRMSHDCTSLIVVMSAARNAAWLPASAQVSAFIEKPFNIDAFVHRVNGVMAAAN